MSPGEPVGPLPAPGAPRGSRVLTSLALALLVLFSTGVRVQTGERDRNFAAGPREGLLKSDPALLIYLTERVAAASGAFPEDWRADPRVQHPGPTDVPAEFTVGQELLVGWLYRLLGSDAPLERFALRVMALVASLAVLGAYALAGAWARLPRGSRQAAGVGPAARDAARDADQAERARARAWGLYGAALFVCLPANYRTMGFVLVREDLSFPLFALHLGLLARAAGGAAWPRATWLASGLALAGALATWHAASFLLALELVVLLAWFLRSGRNPFALTSGPAGPPAGAGAWLVAAPALAAATLVPALRESGVAFSAATLGAWALAGGALLGGRAASPRGQRLAVLGCLALGALGLVLLDRGTDAGYAHVREVLFAKLRHLGRYPWEDPASISFDARLLWQGPFATLDVGRFVAQHRLPVAFGLLVLAAGVPAWRRRGGRAALALAAGGLLVACLAAWLFERLQIGVGLLLAASVPAVLAQLARGRHGTGRGRLVVLAAATLLAVQLASFAGTVRSYVNPWYVPAVRQREIAALVDWTRTGLDPAEPVLGDFMNSTALLAWTARPIVLQPKYETARSRRRAEAFLSTFFHGTTAELSRLARERFDTRVLLVDRYTLWELSRTTAGLPLSTPEPLAGTAAAALLSRDEEVLRSIPGYTLLYRSSPDLLGRGGEPSDFFRVFRLE